MNKNKTNLIDRSIKYFAIVEGKDQIYTCTICAEEKSGKQRSNLTSHLQKRHNAVYRSEIVKTAGHDVKMERLILLQTLTEIVAIDQLPFNCLLKSGFQKLVSEKVSRCDDEGAPINLTDPNFKELKEHLQNTADKIKKKIAEEVGTKLLSMSCDIVSKNGRSIVGIYVQHILHGVLKVRCIGMIQLRERHTGEYLCRIIKSRFEDFGWELNRLVALTTDNGSNMKTLLKNINMSEQHRCVLINKSMRVEI